MRKPDDRLVGVMVREAMTWFDMGALFASPVFYGIRVAPGDGKVVVVIPGFMGNDLYLQPMLNWLDRIGYTPARSSLNPSAGCLDRSFQQVKREIDRHLSRKQRSIALIGHSRGGAVAWTLAAQMQEQVSHLIMLGAPAPGLSRLIEDGSHRFRLSQLSKMLLHANRLSRNMLHPDCGFPSCECSFINNAERPLSQATALLSIYGNDDLVVPDAAKILQGQTIHVPTSHIGLVYHPEVYRLVSQFLAPRSRLLPDKIQGPSLQLVPQTSRRQQSPSPGVALRAP